MGAHAHVVLQSNIASTVQLEQGEGITVLYFESTGAGDTPRALPSLYLR